MIIPRSPFVFIQFLVILLLACSACSRQPVYKVNLTASVCSSDSANTCNWMSDLLKTYPSQSITLANICLPASHDACMYLTQHCTAFANSGNTQTQYLPMKQQLEAGLRMFDVRPWYFENDFYAHHSTHCDGLGCKGDQLKNVLSQTREFLESHAELVIINLSHFCHTSAGDTVLLNFLVSNLGDQYFAGSGRAGRGLASLCQSRSRRLGGDCAGL